MWNSELPILKLPIKFFIKHRLFFLRFPSNTIAQKILANISFWRGTTNPNFSYCFLSKLSWIPTIWHPHDTSCWENPYNKLKEETCTVNHNLAYCYQLLYYLCRSFGKSSHRKRPMNNVLLNTSQNSQENTYARVSFLITLPAWCLPLY